MANTQDPLPKERDLLGEGWGFPVRVTVQGGFQQSQDYRNLDESIVIILGTRLGERVYRPDFGSRLHELVFAPLNDDTLLLAQIYAREALQQWEPRITIESVTATPLPDAASLSITVHYRVRTTHHRRSLVYPFYLTPSV
ncbi:GPW/gp25 family protein [Leptothoe spongobia]|uniref:GPW/gp25 family protein n=1 Tax=Leptothoe spongobia TAU-MAC 1115 TaxID=1967444 RepID=A0A947DCN5_9CYAN|nr:GPW/gp25 family protein [Leptothoe spongobia]MBT9314528.1 GPW/gp25 family protein [Leptothoe spongobia TAU-MAC 1115]